MDTSNFKPIQIFVQTLQAKTIVLDMDRKSTIIDMKRKVNEFLIIDIPTNEQRLIYNGVELSDDNKTINQYQIMNECTIQLLLRLNGGRLQGQILQKSLLYLRPRGYMGINDEKLHCLMMAKLVNTRQIHLLTLVKYFYARMAIYHQHPIQNPARFRRYRAAEIQRKPFLFPRNIL